MAKRRSWIPADAEEQCAVLVGGTQALQDEAARVGAAAGVALIPAPSVAAALRRRPSVLLLASDSEEERIPPGCPVIVVGLRGGEDAVWAAAARRGAGRVAILPQAAGWLAEYLGRTRSAAAGRVLGVLGASGGSGASTLSCWLADCSASAGSGTLLVDGDRAGGGLELALDGEPAAGMRWEDLGGVRGALNPAQFAAALPVVRGFSLLSHGPARETPAGPWDGWSAAAEPVMDAARQGFQTTIVDLGAPTGSDASLAGACDGVVLVVQARVRAVTAAAALLPGLAPVPVRVVLRGPIHSGLDPQRVAGALDVPYPALLPHLRGAPAAEAQGRLLELGRRRLPRRLCRSLLGAFPAGFTEGTADGWAAV